MTYSTVQTYVRRLEAKGYSTAQRVGRNRFYRSTLRKSQVLSEAIEEIIDRLFDGQLFSMVHHLLDSRDITEQEIQHLTTLVKQLQGGEQDNAQP